MLPSTAAPSFHSSPLSTMILALLQHFVHPSAPRARRRISATSSTDPRTQPLQNRVRICKDSALLRWQHSVGPYESVHLATVGGNVAFRSDCFPERENTITFLHRSLPSRLQKELKASSFIASLFPGLDLYPTLHIIFYPISTPTCACLHVVNPFA